MQRNGRPVVTYDTALLAQDMAVKGWLDKDLAREADVADRTVARFLTGQIQTAKTLKKLARALGRSTSRYIVRDSAFQEVGR